MALAAVLVLRRDATALCIVHLISLLLMPSWRAVTSVTYVAQSRSGTLAGVLWNDPTWQALLGYTLPGHGGG